MQSRLLFKFFSFTSLQGYWHPLLISEVSEWHSKFLNWSTSGSFMGKKKVQLRHRSSPSTVSLMGKFYTPLLIFDLDFLLTCTVIMYMYIVLLTRGCWWMKHSFTGEGLSHQPFRKKRTNGSFVRLLTHVLQNPPRVPCPSAMSAQ